MFPELIPLITARNFLIYCLPKLWGRKHIGLMCWWQQDCKEHLRIFSDVSKQKFLNLFNTKASLEKDSADWREYLFKIIQNVVTRHLSSCQRGVSGEEGRCCTHIKVHFRRLWFLRYCCPLLRVHFCSFVKTSIKLHCVIPYSSWVVCTVCFDKKYFFEK